MNSLTYDQIIAVTQSTPFILATIAVVFIPIILYLIVAGNIHSRGSDGRKLKKSMLSSPNAIIPVVIWLFSQAGLMFVLYFFPLWAKFFN